MMTASERIITSEIMAFCASLTDKELANLSTVIQQDLDPEIWVLNYEEIKYLFADKNFKVIKNAIITAAIMRFC